MPATATTLKYAPIVAVDLSNNPIEFADAEEAGHRVQISIPAADLNTCCIWNRAAGSDRPVGSILSAAFKGFLETALAGTYTDLDAIASALSFSSGTLVNADNVSNSVNDLVMAYVLYKVYGLSAYDTANKVFNTGDAKNMVTNSDVSTAVKTSIDAHNARGDAVDQMFRDLLAADPLRFFDLSGNQIAGLFETNADADGSGNWQLTTDDILEIKLELNFVQQVSRRVVRSQQQPTSANNTLNSLTETVTEEQVIPAGSKIKVRLQIKASA